MEARGIVLLPTRDIAANKECASRKVHTHQRQMLGSSTKVVLTLTLLLASCCHCVPIPSTGEKELTGVWWHIPCGPGEEMPGIKPLGANGQIKSWRKTQTQLKLTEQHYKSLQIREIYASVVGVLEQAYNYSWLPGGQLKWFEDRFGKFEKFEDANKKSGDILLALHVALQKFAVTLDRLYRHKHGEENSQFGIQRFQVLRDLRLKLKALLCEVETSLSEAGGMSDSPPMVTEVFAHNWDSRPDTTAVMIQDWGILRSYETFIEDWRSIVDKLLKSASGGKMRQLNPKGNGERRGKGKGRGGARGQKRLKERQSSEEGERIGRKTEEGRGRRNGGERKRENRRERLRRKEGRGRGQQRSQEQRRSQEGQQSLDQ